MWVFVIFSRMRVQFWKFLDLKQNIYFMRPRDTYTIESAWEFSLARGRMRNVPSGFPCNKRSAVARSQSTYHVDWSLCGSACSTMSWGADLLSCFPCSSCSSILSILCELTLRSNNHLKYGKVYNMLVLDKSRTHKFSRVHWYFPFQIPMKFLLILKVTSVIRLGRGETWRLYGSFRFQMSHKKMRDGDYVPLHFYSLETFLSITNAPVQVLSHWKFCKRDIVSLHENPSYKP